MLAAKLTLVGSTGAPSVTVADASVTPAGSTGELAMSSVTVALAAWPSVTTPVGTSKNTAQPEAVLTVAFGSGASDASRNFGPIAPPPITRFDPATPLRGCPAASTSRTNITPLAAVGG